MSHADPQSLAARHDAPASRSKMLDFARRLRLLAEDPAQAAAKVDPWKARIRDLGFLPDAVIDYTPSDPREGLQYLADVLTTAAGGPEEPVAPVPSTAQSLYFLPGWIQSPKVRLEQRIDALTSALRSKPDWQQKCQDQEIVAKWRSEAAEQGVTGAMFDFAMEKQLYALPFKSCALVQQVARYASLGGNGVALSPVQCVFQNDTILSEGLTAALQASIAPLEDVPADQKDWHPGSDEQVLDLVHPSLYPLVYGTTRRLAEPMPRGIETWRPHLGCGEVVPPPRKLYRDGNYRTQDAVRYADLHMESVHGACLDDERSAERIAAMIKGGSRHVTRSLRDADRDKQVSRQYAWLPADVSIAADGTATFDSYINNLPPAANAPLYAALEQLLSASIPLLEHTLAQALCMPHKSIPFDMRRQLRVPPSDVSEYDSDEADDDADKNMPRFMDKTSGPMTTFPIVPATFTPPQASAELPPLRDTTLQVIVKVAEIVLTPGKPRYPGSSWHLEGMVNEHIAASIIAYVASDNITESKLEFRSKVDDAEFGYEQFDEPGMEAIYGWRDGDPLSLHMGAVTACAGRVICFPNKLQHRVAPFELADKARAGVRKIVVFFVVDPATRIPSTRTVPPQQEAWRWPAGSRDELQSQLPHELASRVQGQVGSGMTHAEALTHREALMRERAAGTQGINQKVFEEQFSLCEH